MDEALFSFPGDGESWLYTNLYTVTLVGEEGYKERKGIIVTFGDLFFLHPRIRPSFRLESSPSHLYISSLSGEPVCKHAMPSM